MRGEFCSLCSSADEQLLLLNHPLPTIGYFKSIMISFPMKNGRKTNSDSLQNPSKDSRLFTSRKFVFRLHKYNWGSFWVLKNLPHYIKSLSSKGEERKEQTRKKEVGGEPQKAIISDLEKKLSRQVLGAGGKKETHPEGDGKWKTNCNSVDTQDLKTYLLKPREAQTQMFKSDYSRFITLKLSFGRGKKMKATVA